MQIINRTEGWGTQGNHYLSMSAQEAACILSDDYWAIIERRAKKKKRVSAVCGVEERTKGRK